ncbi:ABC transporter substrate-binding protein [Homoserinibacter sp. YIM 151385]|uniref:ABC transporter substrate-binding protein n=1 Tax=Homoserinibacter sp. YIM 151385 TaxID=2985506 RepID=UPI0022EFE84D|nr:ABC transporter substrate-binding protein [Homoserinibacter sp. YIM 151385]WBU36718.1 ABC transporter substrate-binding protein [Homoserinibacter sp. YIM 151385]
MRRPLVIAASLAAATALVLTGCSTGGGDSTAAANGEPVDGGTLVYATDIQPTAGGLDPYSSVAFANQNMLVQIYETLLTKSDDGEIMPGLAESWEQVDDTTYTVTLREGVTFSDGSPLTAEDVVFSFDTMTTAPAVTATLLTGLAETTAIDEQTVQFTLSAPNGTFLNVIAARGTAYIVNQAWYESTPAEARQREALGTGPFVLDEWVDNVSLTLTKNEQYWQEGLPHLDVLEFQFLPDETARISALRQGAGVDAAWTRDAALVADLDGQGFAFGENASTRGLNIYVNAQSGPLADVRVRQAISLALDRQAIIDLAAGGNGELSLTVPAGDPTAVLPDEDTPLYTQDIDAAKKLLAEAGQESPTISLTYATDASLAIDVPAYEVMKEQLAEAGITLELNGTTWTEVVGAVVSGGYTDLIAVPGYYQPDMTAYFNFFLVPGAATNKVTAEGDPGVAELAELRGVIEPAERAEKLEALEDLVADQAYVYTLFAQAQRFEAWSERVQGYVADPFTYRWNLVNAWLAD